MGFGLNNLVREQKNNWGSIICNPIYMAVILTLIIILIVYCLFYKKANAKRMFRLFTYVLFANILALIIHFKITDRIISDKYEDRNKNNIMNDARNIEIKTHLPSVAAPIERPMPAV